MSGSTRVTQASELHTLTLETPCISFAPGPPGPDGRPCPDEQSQEQRYHASARARFEAVLAPLDPGLGQALAALRAARPELGLVPWSAELPLVPCFDEWALTRYREAGAGACRLSQRVTAPGVDGDGLDGTLELAFAKLPEKEVAERLGDEVAAEIERLRRAARPPAEPEVAPPPAAGGSALGLVVAFLLGTALGVGALLLFGRS
jgi:hypothetical protein